VNAGNAMDKGAHLTSVLPIGDEKPSHINYSLTYVADVHNGQCKDLAFVANRFMSLGLEQGWFKPQPHQEIKGGLNGVQEGLNNLKAGKASAVKYVYKIADSAGIAQK